MEYFVENRRVRWYSVQRHVKGEKMTVDSGMELHQAIYQFYRTQIQFGLYQYGEKLPSLEETCKRFHTSLDTVNPAYHRLRQEGYIAISKKSGAKVAIRYGPEQVRRHIQTFYAERRESLTDLSRCIWPLLGQAQCLALKTGPLKAADLEQFVDAGSHSAILAVWRVLDHKYNHLGNELLMRLIRYLYLYFYGSFWGVAKDERLHAITVRQLKAAADLCREERWDELPDVLRVIQDEFYRSLCLFYRENIPPEPACRQVAFSWDAYKKSSQLRYSLAMELLTEIGRGVYPVGSYLPSAERPSAEKGVSVSTVRRAVSLLNSVGAVKSSRPLGARVLPPSQSADHCDFTQPDLRRRLLDVAESLQIFALSGKDVSELTLSSLDEASLLSWKQYLMDLKRRGLSQRVIYASLFLISRDAPSQTLRTIYSELLQLLFWGNPIEALMGELEHDPLFFVSSLERMAASLERRETAVFSYTLEFLLIHELRRTVEVLLGLGIREAGNILIPDTNNQWKIMDTRR